LESLVAAGTRKIRIRDGTEPVYRVLSFEKDWLRVREADCVIGKRELLTEAAKELMEKSILVDIPG